MNKTIIVLLVLLLLILQYKLWFADDSVQTFHLKKQIAEQQGQNTQLQDRNAKIAANIKSLKTSNSSIESSARKDLGMIKKGETFYQTAVDN